jgi:hypothetical protein
MSARAHSVLLAVLVPLTACDSDSPNPFRDPGRTVPPPAPDEVVFTSNVYDVAPGLPRDAFSMTPGAEGPTRLTFCNLGGTACDTIEAVPSSDRQRFALRRIFRDTDGDGELSPADAAELIVADLERGIQAPVIPELWDVSGVDWFGADQLLVSATPDGAASEDLFVMRFNGADRRALTADATGALTQDVRERRPQIDNSGTVAVYERIEDDGKGTIWLFSSSAQQFQLTFGGPGSEPLPGGTYVVGSDADPSFSPDNTLVVFRRATGLGDDGSGTWDIVTVNTLVSESATREERVIVDGARYRGAPDWGPKGIVFEERAEDGSTQIVVLQPDGSGRQVLRSFEAGFLATYPCWLPDAAE